MSKCCLSPAVISPGIRRHKVSPIIFTVICLLLELKTQRAEQFCSESFIGPSSTVEAAVYWAVFEPATSLGIEPTMSRPAGDWTGENFTIYILSSSCILAPILSTQKLSVLHISVLFEHDGLIFVTFVNQSWLLKWKA